MHLSLVAERLWGQKAKVSYLLIASALLLFTFLGGREIWTQEHRWADIVSGMFFRHDFLHPYLGMNRYYDKPLLSYWFIVLFAKLTGSLTTWVLRLPSAMAGMLAIWSIYRLGCQLKDRQLGLLSGWLLLTTFYFVFWARTSSADMLNLAGSLFAVCWYVEKRDQATFFDYVIFFVIVALTSLCKGLIGAVVPLIAVGVDVIMRRSRKSYLHWRVGLSLLPAVFIYLFPFWASSYFGGDSYGQNGLYLVYRENILRYLQPFDHQGAIYTYFIYLPIYLLPWAVFFIPALFSLTSRWKTLSLSSKWIAWTVFSLFIFLTLSGSRRSYYVLPLVPFAILLTADWLLSRATFFSYRQMWSAAMTVVSFFLLLAALDIAPTWYYSQYGVSRFVGILKEEAGHIKPWESWNVVMLDAESKLNFYLRLSPDTKHYGINGLRSEQTATTLVATWPILTNKPPHTIFISRKLYASLLQGYFIGYRMVEMPSSSGLSALQSHDLNAPIAFIPNN